MRHNELREKDVKQLQIELDSACKELVNLRIQHSLGHTKPHEIKQQRKKVAVINTLITEKQQQD